MIISHKILLCYIFSVLKSDLLLDEYPNRWINKADMQRFHIHNTLYDLPQIYTLAVLIDTYENHPKNEAEKNDEEICYKHGNIVIFYSDIFSDVREAMGYVHSQGYPIPLLKQKTLENQRNKKDEPAPLPAK